MPHRCELHRNEVLVRRRAGAKTVGQQLRSWGIGGRKRLPHLGHHPLAPNPDPADTALVLTIPEMMRGHQTPDGLLVWPRWLPASTVPLNQRLPYCAIVSPRFCVSGTQVSDAPANT